MKLNLLDAVRINRYIFNLKIIQQRIDNKVTDLVLICQHAVLYDLNLITYEWCKLEVEGPLFIIQRSIQPYFQFLILNRKSMENYLQSITADSIVEIQEQYLFFAGAGMERVVGLWLYEIHESTLIMNLILQLQVKLEQIPIQASYNIAQQISNNIKNPIIPTEQLIHSFQPFTQQYIQSQSTIPPVSFTNHCSLSELIFPIELIPPVHIPLPPSGLSRDAYRQYLLTLLKDNQYMDHVYHKYMATNN
jgi:hypothetical protein